MAGKPYRRFCFVCYPESCDIDKSILQSGARGWCWILHDRDVDDNGILKSPHYHVYLDFSSDRQISPIAKKFCIAENLVEYCKSPRSIIRYFLHLDNPDKVQYDQSELHYASVNIRKYLGDGDEGQRVCAVLDIIAELAESGVSYSQLVREVCVSGLYDVYRRGQSTFYHVWCESIGRRGIDG